MPRQRRKPSKPKTTSAIDEARVTDMSPATIRRIMTEAKRGAANPRLGSQLGRLYLHGQITEIEFRAGVRFAELRRRWRFIQGIRQPGAQSAKLGQVIGMPPDVDSERAEAVSLAEEASRAVAMTTPGYNGARAFDIACRVCELDEIPVGYGEMMTLRAVLMGLAIHWEMIRRPVIDRVA